MESEVLIQLVRSHPELYDADHPKYLDASHKEDIWQQIGWEFNRPASMCKSRWSNIRDNYRKYLKKTVTGTGKAKVCRYRYSRQLQFLDTYMRKRTNTGLLHPLSFEEPTKVKEESTPDWIQAEDITLENNHLPEDEDSDREEQKSNEEADQINTTSNQTRKKRQFSFVSPPTKRRSQPKQPGTSTALIKYLLEKKDIEEKTSNQQPDAVDAFLAGLAPTLKKLPPYFLNLAKTRIFGIVQEYELRMIMEADKEPNMSLNSLPSLSPPSQYSPSPTPVASPLTSEAVDPISS